MGIVNIVEENREIWGKSRLCEELWISGSCGRLTAAKEMVTFKFKIDSRNTLKQTFRRTNEIALIPCITFSICLRSFFASLIGRCIFFGVLPGSAFRFVLTMYSRWPKWLTIFFLFVLALMYSCTGGCYRN